MVVDAVTFVRTRSHFQYSLCRVVLMVDWFQRVWAAISNFQYSLCRVVLMVRDKAEWLCQELLFQYSLCRVVLMVETDYSSF